MIQEFAVDAMQKDGMAVSIEDDHAAVECREHVDGVIDTGDVHDLAREHDLAVERVLGDIEQGVVIVHVSESIGDQSERDGS